MIAWIKSLFEKKEKRKDTMLMPCRKCGQTDIILKEAADTWKCPFCEFQWQLSKTSVGYKCNIKPEGDFNIAIYNPEKPVVRRSDVERN